MMCFAEVVGTNGRDVVCSGYRIVNGTRAASFGRYVPIFQVAARGGPGLVTTVAYLKQTGVQLVHTRTADREWLLDSR